MHNPFTLLDYQARINGDALAWANSKSTLTFAQIRGVAARMSTRLAELGIQTGQSVFIATQPDLDWLLICALMHRGCISCSSHGAGAKNLPYEPDWIVTDNPAVSGDNVIRIDQQWLADLATYPADEPCISFDSPESICRMVMTSGTTGVSKVAPLSVDVFLKRSDRLVGDWVSTRGDSLNLMPLSTIGGLYSAVYSWRSGRPYFTYSTPASVIEVMKKYRLACLTGSPTQLANFLDAIGQHPVTLPDLREVRMAGSAVSPRLVKAPKNALKVYVEKYCPFSLNSSLLLTKNPGR